MKNQNNFDFRIHYKKKINDGIFVLRAQKRETNYCMFGFYN